MNIKILLMFLFLVKNNFAAEQKPESGVSKFFKNMFTCGAGFEAARPDYIERSRQAQREIGIPEHKLVKTYEIDPKHAPKLAGRATIFGIHINQKYCDTISYGRPRFTLLHEAAHIKNHDTLVCGLKMTVAGIFFGTVLIGSPVAAYNTIEAVAINIHKSCEHRADMSAALALQCASCLQERMKHPHYDQDVKKLGYMSTAEYQPILDGYLRDKKMCGYHLQQLKPFDECKE